MKNCQPILITAALLMVLNLMLPAAPPKAGYLTRGTPFGLRKADRTRPPVYSLPPLPITPDPQPLPLTSGNPAQPLNPAGTPAPRVTIPAMTVPTTQPFKMEARTIFLPTPAMVSPFGQPQAAGVNPATGAFLNPQILRYFNMDANGTYQSRILLNGSSLFTLPSMNPLSQRGSSATYQIK
jgi:hypothetical protein